ncbi:MAG: pentapeptide repeat-containing protein [Leptolyngbya sp. SIOISBB]|nr:pentapeptide repeat-containing protein [Leptolyngbya sp. SIOISBB]
MASWFRRRTLRKDRRPFNKIERQLEAIPTWRLITEVVVILAGLAIILEPDKSINPAKVIFDSSESIAIASAVILYFKEIPERKKQKHYEAWQVIDSAREIQTSYARRTAIEDLHKDGVSFYEIDLPWADLQGIDLSDTNLSRAYLSGANLSRAKLSDANLSRAKLYEADLSGAKLSGANLSRAKLSDANLSRANLYEADLSGAKLSRANLSRAYLTNIKWDEGTQWPAPEEVAKARNIPEELKRQLGIIE